MPHRTRGHPKGPRCPVVPTLVSVRLDVCERDYWMRTVNPTPVVELAPASRFPVNT